MPVQGREARLLLDQDAGAGPYTLEVQVTNALGDQQTLSLIIDPIDTPTPGAAIERIQVAYGRNNVAEPVPAGWNKFTANQNASIANAINADGLPSGVAVTMAHTGGSDSYAPGAYEDVALGISIPQAVGARARLIEPGETGTSTFSVDAAYTYQVHVFNSQAKSGQTTSPTSVNVNGTVKTVDAITERKFLSFPVSGTGTITVACTATGSVDGALTAIVIEKYGAPGGGGGNGTPSVALDATTAQQMAGINANWSAFTGPATYNVAVYNAQGLHEILAYQTTATSLTYHPDLNTPAGNYTIRVIEGNPVEIGNPITAESDTFSVTAKTFTRSGNRTANATDATEMPGVSVGDIIVGTPGGSNADVFLNDSSMANLGVATAAKIHFIAGKYNTCRFLCNGINRVSNPLVITNFGGQVRYTALTIHNGKGLRVSGKYIANQQGFVGCQGHGSNWSYSRYGFDGGIISAGLYSGAGPVGDIELEYFRSYAGGASGVKIKNDNVDENMGICKMHDGLIAAPEDEGVYAGNTGNDPQSDFNELHIYNMRGFMSEMDLIQTNRAKKTYIYNNTMIASAHWWKKPPIGGGQDFGFSCSCQLEGSEDAVFDMHHNVFIGFAHAGQIFITGDGDASGNATIRFEDNVLLKGKAAWAVYVKESASASATTPIAGRVNFHAKRNYIGQFDYQYSQLSNAGGEASTTGASHCFRMEFGGTAVFQDNSRDSSIQNLFASWSTAGNNLSATESGNSVVTLPDVDFMGFIEDGDFDLARFEEHTSLIYEDVSTQSPPSGAGNPVSYPATAWVTDERKFYKALRSNSQKTPAANPLDWALQTFAFGSELPPFDVRMKSDNAYAALGIGVGYSSSIAPSPTTPQAPPAPTNFTATRVDSTTANLAWGASTGADRYIVQGKTIDLANTTYISNPTASNYQATGLPADAAYDFEIWARTTVNSVNYDSAHVTVRLAASGGAAGGAGTYQAVTVGSYHGKLWSPAGYTPGDPVKAVVDFCGTGQRGNPNGSEINKVDSGGMGKFIIDGYQPDELVLVFQMPDTFASVTFLANAALDWMENNHSGITLMTLGGYSLGSGILTEIADNNPEIVSQIDQYYTIANRTNRTQDNGAGVGNFVGLTGWFIYGDADTSVTTGQTPLWANDINAAGGDVVNTILPGVGHGSTQAMYSELFPFLGGDQTRGQAPANNVAPSSIQLTNESVPGGYTGVVGTLSAQGTPAPTFTVTGGAQGSDFSISGNNLVIDTAVSAGNTKQVQITASNGEAPDATRTFNIAGQAAQAPRGTGTEHKFNTGQTAHSVAGFTGLIGNPYNELSATDNGVTVTTRAKPNWMTWDGNPNTGDGTNGATPSGWTNTYFPAEAANQYFFQGDNNPTTGTYENNELIEVSGLAPGTTYEFIPLTYRDNSQNRVTEVQIEGANTKTVINQGNAKDNSASAVSTGFQPRPDGTASIRFKRNTQFLFGYLNAFVLKEE